MPSKPTAAQALDLAALTSVPLLTTSGYITLIKNLLEASPSNPPPMVQAALAQLEQALSRAEAGLVERIGDDVDLGLERAFDGFVDRVWMAIRARFDFWHLYDHEGAGLLTQGERDVLDFDVGREQAARALDLGQRLFGDGNFLRRPYPEQAAEMAARLRFVEQGELEDLFGPRAAELIRVCQTRYEAMVSARGSRSAHRLADLREVRRELQRVITIYSGVVAGMVYIGEADATVVVERALQPIMSARSRRRGGGLAVGEVEEFGEAEVTAGDETDSFADGEAADESAPVDLGAQPDADLKQSA